MKLGPFNRMRRRVDAIAADVAAANADQAEREAIEIQAQYTDEELCAEIAALESELGAPAPDVHELQKAFDRMSNA